MKLLDTRSLSESGAWVHLTDVETGAPLYWTDAKGKEDATRPVRVRVLGPDSVVAQKRANARAAEQIKRTRGQTNFAEMSVEQIVGVLEGVERDRAESMADATVDWENVPGADGEPMGFSVAAAADLYARIPWVLDQLAKVQGDRARFISAARKG